MRDYTLRGPLRSRKEGRATRFCKQHICAVCALGDERGQIQVRAVPERGGTFPLAAREGPSNSRKIPRNGLRGIFVLYHFLPQSVRVHRCELKNPSFNSSLCGKELMRTRFLHTLTLGRNDNYYFKKLTPKKDKAGFTPAVKSFYDKTTLTAKILPKAKDLRELFYQPKRPFI